MGAAGLSPTPQLGRVRKLMLQTRAGGQSTLDKYRHERTMVCVVSIFAIPWWVLTQTSLKRIVFDPVNNENVWLTTCQLPRMFYSSPACHYDSTFHSELPYIGVGGLFILDRIIQRCHYKLPSPWCGMKLNVLMLIWPSGRDNQCVKLYP